MFQIYILNCFAKHFLRNNNFDLLKISLKSHRINFQKCIILQNNLIHTLNDLQKPAVALYRNTEMLKSEWVGPQ